MTWQNLPWKAVFFSTLVGPGAGTNAKGWAVVDCCGTKHAEVEYREDSSLSFEDQRTIADTLAAAPELLEALKDVTERLALSLQVFGNSPEIVNGNVAKARAAIAKAEG